MALGKRGYIVNLHPESYIRFVAAIVIHSIIPAHTRNRIWNLHIQHILEEPSHKTLKGIEHILLLHKGHLAIYLCKLRLTVCPEVLISETADNLEISVIAGNHKKLLECLRALRKSIEGARVHSGRNHKVSCALRCGFYKVWSLYLHKILRIQIVAHLVRHTVTERKRSLKRSSS